MEATIKKKSRTNTGAGNYSGPWGDDQKRHLLRRVLFGFNLDDLTFFKNMSLSQMVTYLLNVPTDLPGPPVNHYNNSRITDPDIPFGETWVNGPINNNFNSQRGQSYRYWWMARTLSQERHIREKLTIFWHNHFATELTVANDPYMAYRHNQLLRKNCLGSFKQFVKEITLDPLMLRYLNGEKNSKNAPDENYARELQELFTLGKGPDSQYTEDDVRSVARVLTGWRVNRKDWTSYFQANRHDETDKQFSSFFNNKVINGQSGDAAGEAELDELLNMIFAKDEVAKFIVRRLYTFFIYYEIDDNVEINFISPMASIFRNSNYNIKTLLTAFFSSEHFFDPANMGCMIKNPIDYFVGLQKSMYMELPDESDTANSYFFYQQYYNVAASQQMALHDPPSVSGWPAYHQTPQFHQLWINTDTLPKRNQITDLLLLVGFKKEQIVHKAEYLALTEKLSKPEDPNILIEDLIKYLHTVDSDASNKEYMKSILLGGLPQDFYWTNVWNDYINDKQNETKRNIVLLRLSQLYKYLLNLSEFQLS